MAESRSAASPKDREDAARLVAQLERAWLGKGRGREFRPYLERQDIFMADVETAVERFAFQLDMVDRALPGFPCFQVEGQKEPILIDVFAPWGLELEPWAPFPPMFWGRRFELMLERFSRSRGPRVQLDFGSRERAEHAFRERLSAFLASRLSARRSDISADPGLQFSVHANRHGLRVHYSPAYFLDIQRIFGSPTSPVSQWIQPGRYVFGLRQPGDPVPWFDLTAEYDVPPLTRADLEMP